jgi:hypothetical protein
MSTPAHPAGGAGDIVEQSNAGQARGSATALDRKTQGVTAGETAPIVDRLRKYRGGDTQFRHLMDEAADVEQSNAGQARGSATALDRKTQGVTAGETAPIVDRLRKYRGGDTQFRHLMDEAADLIQSLQASLSISEGNVGRLREALTTAASCLAQCASGEATQSDMETWAEDAIASLGEG